MSGLNEQEVLAIGFVLLSSGYDMTICLLGHTVLALLDHLEQMALLRAHPALISSAVEETRRYDSSSQVTIRVVAEPLEIAGQTFTEGHLV